MGSISAASLSSCGMRVIARVISLPMAAKELYSSGTTNKEHNDNYADHYNQRQQKAPDALHLTHSFNFALPFSCKEVALKKTHGHIQHKCNTPTIRNGAVRPTT